MAQTKKPSTQSNGKGNLRVIDKREGAVATMKQETGSSIADKKG